MDRPSRSQGWAALARLGCLCHDRRDALSSASSLPTGACSFSFNELSQGIFMKLATVALAALALPLVAFAQTPAPTAKPAAATAKPAVAPTLVGVWKRIEVEVSAGADKGKHTTDVQPSLYIFTKAHYSVTSVTNFKPRPALSAKPTDAETVAAFTPFAGNAGTYKLDGAKITFNRVVSKDPALMSAGAAPPTGDLEWAGKDVWLTTTAADGSKTRARLTRVAD